MSDEANEEQGAEAAAGEGAGTWPVDRLRPVVEALVFAAGDPLPAKKIVDLVEGATLDEVKATLAELATDYLTRGIRLVEVAGGWQMRTAPEHQRYVRKLFRERPQRLTRAATETVAIVAYKQPVTRQEVESVRGVDTGGVLESLIEKRLVKVIGRKDVPGRPLVYATTQEFLELFGLRNIRELPTLPELGSDFERMSEQGGFHESEPGAILPLEDGDLGDESADENDAQRAGRHAQGASRHAEENGNESAGEARGEAASEEDPETRGDD